MTMKKTTIFLAFLLLGATLNMSAQQPNKKKKTFEEKISKFVKQTKKELEQAGHELGDAIGFDDRLYSKSDLLRVNGSYYMPLYSTDMYKGDSALAFRTQCTKLFRQKYPKANILSVAIPQKDWTLEKIERDDEIVGYRKTLHCFIIARDGDEGYINAKFTYSQSKKVGHDFVRSVAEWPKWERADVLTTSVYQQLLKL